MTRWNRFYQKQLEDKKLKTLVEQELEALRIGAKNRRAAGGRRLNTNQARCESGNAEL